MPEYRTLTTLLPRIATATLLVLLAGTFIGNNEASGTLNKPMYLVILALGFAITALFLRSRQSTRHRHSPRRGLVRRPAVGHLVI